MPKQITNQQTGEIIPLRGSRSIIPPPSNDSAVTTIQTITGASSKAINLKDHPEFSGLVCQFEKVVWKEKKTTKGDENPLYFLAHCYIFPRGTQPTSDHYVKLMTGATLIVERLQDAELAAEDGTPYPLRGLLRKSSTGDSWYLEDIE